VGAGEAAYHAIGAIRVGTGFKEAVLKTLLLVLCVAGLVAVLGSAQGADYGQVVDDGYGAFLFAPAGEFLMGDVREEGNPRERPSHPVTVDSYFIGAYEVTNADYARFMDDGGYADPAYWGAGGFNRFGAPRYWSNQACRGGGIPGNGRFPVVGVSWYEANAYCAWLSVRTAEAYRLPTEAEWEKAARGGHFLDGDERALVPNPIDPPRRYPWGNDIDGSYANYLASGDPYEPGLTPVGYFDGDTHDGFATHSNASPYGAYDLSGNVYEWCIDGYSETYYQQCLDSGIVANPRGLRIASSYVIRGSAFDYKTFKQRCAYRGAYYPTARMAYIGFRCVREMNVELP